MGTWVSPVGDRGQLMRVISLLPWVELWSSGFVASTFTQRAILLASPLPIQFLGPKVKRRDEEALEEGASFKSVTRLLSSMGSWRGGGVEVIIQGLPRDLSDITGCFLGGT